MSAAPRVKDNDRDEIVVMLGDRILRSYCYDDEAERRIKIGKAREYVEGWYVARDAHSEALTTALNGLDGLSYIHDGNPSDAMADIPPLDYARHMLFEARQAARQAASEARSALAEEGLQP